MNKNNQLIYLVNSKQMCTYIRRILENPGIRLLIFLTASSAEQVLGIAFQEEKNNRHSVTFWKFLGISQCYIIRNRNIVENNQIK